MEYRRLGKSGLQVSVLSLGSWLTFGKQISDDVAEQLMDIAYEAGINFFDNSEGYAGGKSEIVMGNILKKKAWDRSTYVVSTKLYFGLYGNDNKPNQQGLSRKHLVEGCHTALKRLQMEYVDLLFCHRPDKTTPIEETVWTMHNLIQQGKALYWGTSEWSASELMEAYLVAEKNHLIAPTMEQPQYNMLVREKVENEYSHLFKYYGLGTTIWSPLASGVLSGKYNDANPNDTRLNIPGLEWLKERTLQAAWVEKAQKIKGVADKLGVSMPKLAIAWCLKNPDVSTVILGASKAEQLRENLQATEVTKQLSPEIMQEIDKILGNKPELPQW